MNGMYQQEEIKLSPLYKLFGESWYNQLKDEFEKEYMRKISARVRSQRMRRIVYPEPEEVFKAYQLTEFETIKVVIIGQDPYYNGAADGLAFSFKGGQRKAGQQSLDVIWTELERDVRFGLYLDFDYDLTWLAEQGVFLLNTILTVDKGTPLSHVGMGWQQFTGVTVGHLIRRKTPMVFMLWGTKAKSFYNKVVNDYKLDDSHHLVLRASHPAYDIRLSKHGEYKNDYPNTFVGCSHFTKANAFISKFHEKEIKW